jgi:16S rRNA (uracil1498-N3)-methyltransferase
MKRRSNARSPRRGPDLPRHRFYVEASPTSEAVTVIGATAHRIARVLRLLPGAAIELFDGSGRVWPATVQALVGHDVSLTLGGPEERLPEPACTLLVGFMRPNRFEWLLEKATELGATALQPVITERSAVRPDEVGAARLERWRRIAIEAAEQCGRASVPAISRPAALGAVLSDVAQPFVVAVEPAHGEAPPLGALLRDIGRGPIVILCGPEGGLSPAEVGAAVARGGRPASLGPLVLRAETAAVAALAILADARVANA